MLSASSWRRSAPLMCRVWSPLRWNSKLDKLSSAIGSALCCLGWYLRQYACGRRQGSEEVLSVQGHGRLVRRPEELVQLT